MMKELELPSVQEQKDALRVLIRTVVIGEDNPLPSYETAKELREAGEFNDADGIVLTRAMLRLSRFALPNESLWKKTVSDFCMDSKIPSTNLFGEDGITIYLDAYFDICERAEASVRVTGREIYGGMTMEAVHQSIRSAYLRHINVADPQATMTAPTLKMLSLLKTMRD